MPSPLLTDLVQIRRLGESKRAENARFRKHLKSHDYPERRFRRLAEAVEEQVDCRACANCCKVALTPLTERDVHNLARAFRLSPAAFLEQYTEGSGDELVLRRTEQGCVFLDGNECSIYDKRPSNCADFPHVVRGAGSIHFRMWQFIDRACYCPIVYNTLEELKAETKFSR